jgi:hypothetical protein
VGHIGSMVAYLAAVQLSRVQLQHFYNPQRAVNSWVRGLQLGMALRERLALEGRQGEKEKGHNVYNNKQTLLVMQCNNGSVFA